MAQSYKIGKIFGIDIELHWTLVALLIGSYLLSLPSGSAFILMFLLFSCVLIHELAHSFVSIRNRVRVSKILLLPLGGASIIDKIGIDPRVEFNIAIAGPLMSILLGCFFGVLVALAPAGPLGQVLQLLFGLNMLLGVFNLLPAFPLDGGRVFRSYLERWYNEYRATKITVKIGKAMMGLILIGTLYYVYSIGNAALSYTKELIFLWNLMIVFFLYGGAQAEMELVELRQHTKGTKVSEVVNRHFVFVEPDADMSDIYATVRSRKMHILITKLGSEYALVNLLGKDRLKPDITARTIATPIPNISTEANIIDALQKMEANEIGIAAVTSKNRLVGVVLLSHLQAFLALHVLKATKSK